MATKGETTKVSTVKKTDKKVKSTSKTSKKKVKEESPSATITDYFPVRRSSRRCQSLIKKETLDSLQERLKDKNEEGLKVIEIEGKGKGVVSTRKFLKGELICEYSGDLISFKEAEEREKEYSRDSSIGCYMYYFEHDGKRLCVDATRDNGRMGRLLNHSSTSPNVYTKLIPIDAHPYLALLAKRDIEMGEELEYDYGERKKEIIEHHPWLKK